MTSAAQARHRELVKMGYRPAPIPRVPEQEVDRLNRERANQYWGRVYAQPPMPALTVEEESIRSLELARAHGHLDRDGIPLRLLQNRLSPRFVFT